MLEDRSRKFGTACGRDAVGWSWEPGVKGNAPGVVLEGPAPGEGVRPGVRADEPPFRG